MDYRVGIYHRQLFEPENSEMMRQSAYYQSWVHQSPDAIIIFDENSRVLFWNAAALHVFGYTSDEALNHNLMKLIIPTESNYHGNNLVLALEKGEQLFLGKPILMELMNKTGDVFMGETTFFQAQLETTCHFMVMVRKHDDLRAVISQQSESQWDLTDEEKSSAELEVLFRVIANDVPVPMWVSDENGQILFLNKAWQDFIGTFEKSPAEIKWSELIFQEDLPKLQADYFAAVEKREVYEGEFRIRSVNGEYQWIYCVAKPWLNNGHIGSFFDITDRKLAEQALIERDAYLEMLGNAMPVFLWQSNEKGELVYFNKAWLDFTGRTLEEEQNKGWMDHIHPDDAPLFIETYTQACGRREPFQFEYRMRRQDGEYRWIIDYGAPLYSDQGEFRGYIGSCVDITVRRNAEQSAYESEQRFRAMADASPMWIWTSDATGQMTYFNKTLLEFLGLPFEKIQAEGWMQCVHPDDVEMAQQKIDEANTDKQPEQLEFRVRRYDGEYRWWLVKSAPRFDNAGNYMGFVASAVDITERKQAEQSIKESEQRFRSVADASPLWIWMVDANEQVTYLSHPLIEFLGLSLETIQMGGWTQCVHPDDEPQLQEAVRRAILEKRNVPLEYRVKRADGEYRWWLAKSMPRFDAAGNYLGFIGTAIDITERRQTEQALRESEQRFRNMSDASPLWIWMLDSQGQPEYVNKPLLEFLGLSFEQLQTGEWVRSVHPDDLSRVQQQIQTAIIEKQGIFSDEYRMKRADGEYRWWLARSVPRFDAAGKYLGFIGTAMDITERRQAEWLVQESEKRFRNMADASPLYIWMVDVPSGEMVYISKPLLEFLGMPLDTNMSLQEWIQCVHPDDIEYVTQKIARNIRERQTSLSQEFRVRRYDGEYRWWLAKSASRFDEDGNYLGFIGTGMDVTEQRIATARFRRVSESNIIGIVAWDWEGAILESNDAFLSMVGYTQEDVANGLINWRAMTPPEYQYLDDVCLAQVKQTGACLPYEKQLFHKDGYRVDILVGTAEMEETPGEGVAFILDITQRRRDEIALQRALGREQIRRRVLELTTHATDWAYEHKVTVDLQPVAELLGQFYQADRCMIVSYVSGLYLGTQTLDLLGQYNASGISPSAPESLLEHLLLEKHLPLSAFADVEASNPEEIEIVLGEKLSPFELSKKDFSAMLQRLTHDLQERKVQSILRIPMLYRDNPYGVVILQQCHSPRQWTPEEKALLVDVAQYIGNAFYEAELQQHEREARRALENSYNLIRIVSEAQGYFISKEETHKVFERLLTRLLAHTESRLGFIGEVVYTDNQSPSLKRFLSNVVLNEDKDAESGKVKIRKLNHLHKKVLASGQVFLSNPLDMAAMGDGAERGYSLLQSFMGIPLYSGEEMVGVVGIANRLGGYDETLAEELQPYLTACANLIVGTRLEELRKKLTRELKASERSLKNYAAKLERSNRDLDQFATVASHDLQAPLRKVIMFSEFLKTSAGEQLPLECYDYIDRIQKSIAKMQVLITDLLLLSRVNRKGRPFKAVNMGEVLRDVLVDLEPVLKKEHGTVQAKSMMTIDADEMQMHQVLQNLLGNSLKFHDANVPPEVELEMRTVDEWNCELIVRDKGIGFDEKYVDRIFEMFERLHGESRFEGTGMGLAIVRKIIERHGGTITAHGTPGKGATFIVTLPIHQASD